MSEPENELVACECVLCLLEKVAKKILELQEENRLLQGELEHERLMCCDDPCDRLYHANDGTWWMRDMNSKCLVVADAPVLEEKND